MTELRDAAEPNSPPPALSAPTLGEAPAELALPPDALIIVPARNMVLFPGIVLPFTLGRPKSIAAAQQAARTELPIGIVLQRDPTIADPAPGDLYEVGTVAAILRYLTAPDGNHHLVCQGQQRFRVIEYLPDYPFLVARVERVADGVATGTEIEARFEQLKQRALDTLQLLPNAPAELAQSVHDIQAPAQLADFIAGFMDLKPAEKQDILATFDLVKRLDKLLWLLAHRIEVLRLSRDIGQQTRDSMESKQREYLLREQLKTIQKELGETDERGAELTDLRKAVAAAGMPPEVEQQANKELARLERMPEGAGESSMVRTYLDWLIELPWSKTSEAPIDIAEARRILDADHFGLPKIKRRIRRGRSTSRRPVASSTTTITGWRRSRSASSSTSRCAS